jgi:beta-N-acetylhexosaminidase
MQEENPDDRRRNDARGRELKGVFVGVAFVAALVLGTSLVLAQSPYDAGGYLERPYLPDDDDGNAAPQETSEAARRRRLRASQQAQQPQAPQPAANPQTTGATQGGSQRRPSGSAQGEAGQPQQRRAAGQGDAPSNSPASNQQKRSTGPNQDDVSNAQRNRQNGGAPRQSGNQPEQRRPSAPAEEVSRRDEAKESIPPIPLRRPQIAKMPAQPAMTARAAPDPAAAVTPVQEARPAKEPESGSANELTKPTPPESAAAGSWEVQSGAEPTTAAGEQPQTPKEASAAAPAEQRPDATAYARPEQSWSPEDSRAEQTQQAATALPAPALDDAQPEMATAQAEPSAGASETASEAPPANMMAATEAPSMDAAAQDSPAKPDEPAAAEAAPRALDQAPAENAAPAQAVSTPQQIASAQPDTEMTAPSVAIPQPQPESLAAKLQESAAAPIAPSPPAIPSAAPLPEATAIAPTAAAQTSAAVRAMQAPLPAAPIKQTRTAAATEAVLAVPQPPARQNVALDKIIGQMLVVGFRGLSPEETWSQKLAAQIKAGVIGGVLFMSHNVQSPQQIKTLTGFLQKTKSEIPVLFAVDQEGGIVQRLSAEKGFQNYPTAGKIGQSNDPLTAYAVYRRLAAELSENGFNLNLGPVVDLLRNDASPIIAGKERSFGSQPKHVAAFAKAFSIAHQDEGVLTVLKHFPGHGSTPFDTHLRPVDVGQSWREDEIIPYRELIASRTARAVMMGHIANPSMADEPGQPASLSAKAIRQVLRGDLGFTGVVISDDLEMGAIRARYSIEDSAVRAIKAGNDIVILSNQNAPSPDLPERITAAIKKAVDTGELRREELQASYDRILSFKQRLPGGVSSVNSGNGGGNVAPAARRASAERGKSASAR